MADAKINKEDLFEFAKLLVYQTDYEELVRLIASKSIQLFKADLISIQMLNPDTRKTVKTIFKDGKSNDQKKYRDIHIHIGGWIISKKESFVSNNIQTDKHFAKGLFSNVHIISVAGVPLIIEGNIIGTIILMYEDSIPNKNLELLKTLECLAVLVTPYLRNTQKIKEYFTLQLPESSLIQKYNNVGLLGKSSRYIEMLQAIEASTKSDARVLLIGKTGTGKELIAKAIHKFSSRSDYPFIAVDCGAIPDNLLESEFFGHKKGAFTGAHSDHQGLFENANGGTLFMDEINNLPLDMQSKLLRVLQEGEIRPIGSNKVIKTNVRIIAASSKPLKELVEQKLFREDLFFRLYIYPIYLPDLNERMEDIPLLANHFLLHYSKQQNKKNVSFHEEVIDFMKFRKWGGNVRELENFVQRIITIADQNISKVESDMFPSDLREELDLFREGQNKLNKRSLKQSVQDFEQNLIKQTLISCNWNQSAAARQLDTSEKNIRYKMEILNIKKL